jgi:hypothetical protein
MQQRILFIGVGVLFLAGVARAVGPSFMAHPLPGGTDIDVIKPLDSRTIVATAPGRPTLTKETGPGEHFVLKNLAPSTTYTLTMSEAPWLEGHTSETGHHVTVTTEAAPKGPYPVRCRAEFVDPTTAAGSPLPHCRFTVDGHPYECTPDANASCTLRLPAFPSSMNVVPTLDPNLDLKRHAKCAWYGAPTAVFSKGVLTLEERVQCTAAP